MLKILVDADLVLVACLNQGEWEEEVEKLWDMMESGQIQAYITEVGIDKIYCIASKMKDPTNVEQAFLDIEEVIHILPIDDAFFKQARLLNFLDFDSALEVVCALANNLGAVVTLKPEDFVGSTLPVLSVSSLLKRQILEDLANFVEPNTEIPLNSELKTSICDSEGGLDLINLSLWLQNDFAEAFLAGWQKIEHINELAFPTFNFRASGEKNKIKLAKKITLTNECSVVIVLDISLITNNEVNILFRLMPFSTQDYLPENLKLSILEPEEVFIQAISRSYDDCIQLEFSGNFRDKFSVEVALNNYLFFEKFII